MTVIFILYLVTLLVLLVEGVIPSYREVLRSRDKDFISWFVIALPWAVLLGMAEMVFTRLTH